MRFLLHGVAHVSHYVVFYTTLPYLFIPSSQLEFENLDFFIPCRSLYCKLWFKLLKLENPILYGHAIRVLFHVVAHVSHYVVFYTTLPYLFIHSSQLEFRNLDFFIPCRSLYRKLWFMLLNSKIWYDTVMLWGFYCMWWLMSLTM